MARAAANAEVLRLRYKVLLSVARSALSFSAFASFCFGLLFSALSFRNLTGLIGQVPLTEKTTQ
jgi:hypothetical protein